MTNIPLVDLAAQHREVADDVAAGWSAVLDRTAFINGPQVAAFEQVAFDQLAAGGAKLVPMKPAKPALPEHCATAR